MGVRKLFCKKHFLIRGPSQKLAFLGLAADLKAKNKKILDRYTFKGVRKLFLSKTCFFSRSESKMSVFGFIG